VRRDESWGLCPQPIALGTFAMICRAAIGQRTLGQVLTAGLANYRVVTSAFSARLRVTEPSVARISVRDSIEDSDARRQFHQTFLFLLYSLICWTTDRRVPLKTVNFVSPASDAGEELIRAYRAPIAYGVEMTELVFDARWLRLANVQDVQSLNELLRHSPGNLAVAFDDKTDIAERVRRYLRKNVGRPNSLDDAATQLRMSVATLRRRLNNEGISFQKLKDDVRRDMSINLLVESDMRLEELAGRVGFLEVSAFHRAFRRWTGCAPSDYRSRATE
jgi:AraC-like DNA-binding protein